MYVHCFGIGSDLQINPAALGGKLFGSDCNNVESDVNNITADLPGWVQIKAGLFKYDPANGYGLRRRQLGIVFGNSRPVVGIIELKDSDNGRYLQWLDDRSWMNTGGGPYDLDYIAGDHYFTSSPPDFELPYNLREMIPQSSDVREAYTIMAGNFGGANLQNPQWQLGVVAPYWTGSYVVFDQFSGGLQLNYGWNLLQYNGGLNRVLGSEGMSRT